MRGAAAEGQPRLFLFGGLEAAAADATADIDSNVAGGIVLRMGKSNERSPGGFIVIYRWQVEEAHQEAFRASWRDVTVEGRALGSLGSCLTRDANGEFLAIALWPSERAREDAFARMMPRTTWLGAMRIEEVKLHVEDDLWTNSPLAAVSWTEQN